MGWTISLLLQVAPLVCGDTATAFDAVVSSPTLWSLVGTNGEVRELWTGPRNGALGRGRVLHLSGYGLVRDGDRWIDLRTLAYARRGSRPGLLVLRAADRVVTLRVTAKRTTPEPVIFLRYAFSRPRDFRFRVDFPGGLSGVTVRHEAALGLTSLHGVRVGSLSIATLPEGRHVKAPGAPDTIIREIKNAAAVTVCFRTGRPETAGKGNTPVVRAWLAVLGGPEDTAEERGRNRIRIHTGVDDLDHMLEASIDAVEANRFAAGGIIAGADGWYKNSWIRDGTYAILGHDLAGFHESSDTFYRFWIREGGFSYGGENEAQQPAIGILGMWFHARLRLSGDAFLKEVFTYVAHYADYYAKRVAREGMLHTAEEWICQVRTPTAWPNAEVCAGLFAASKIATRLGRETEAARWRQAGETLRRAILSTAYDAKRERFIPLAGPAGVIFTDAEHPEAHPLNGPMRDQRVDSGMLMLARAEIFGHGLGVVAVDDPRFAATQAWIQKVLKQPDQAISRFDGNLNSPHYTRGQWPVWPISSAWAADVEWLRGRTDRAWRHLLSGIVRKDGYDAEEAMYYLPEQWQLDGRPVRTTRYLTWSHGELLTSTILLLTGFDLDLPDADIGLSPSLPPESRSATVQGFRFRGWSLDFRLSRGETLTHCELTARRRPDAQGSVKLRVSLSGRVTELTDGQRVAFDGRPLGPAARPVRCAHARERAELYDRILLGRPFPAELADAPVKALEAHIRQVEDRFDRELLVKERARRQTEIRKALEKRRP